MSPSRGVTGPRRLHRDLTCSDGQSLRRSAAFPFSPLPGHEVDVRDCVRMHIALMDDPASDGRRHFCFGTTNGMDEIARVIRENYAKIGLSPHPRQAPGWLMWLMSFVSTDIASIYSKLGHPNLYETKWPSAYHYRHIDIDASVKASIDNMLEHRWLTPRRPQR